MEQPDDGKVRLTEHQLHTAVMMFLKEVRGIPFERVESVLVPVYDASGNVGAMITLKAKP